MFSGVAVTMLNTVAPALAKRVALSEVLEHLAACCSQIYPWEALLFVCAFVDLDR